MESSSALALARALDDQLHDLRRLTGARARLAHLPGGWSITPMVPPDQSPTNACTVRLQVEA